MPWLLTAISALGTAAMLWVGGSIVIHGLEVLEWSAIGHHIQDIATSSAQVIGEASAVVHWVVTAGLDGLFGLALGLATIPIAKFLIAPLARTFSKNAH